MTASAFSCLWPRAIIDLRLPEECRDSEALLKSLLHRFDRNASIVGRAVQLDVTHQQHRLGSPYEIARQLQEFFRQYDSTTPVIGIASHPLVAAFASAFSRGERIHVIAPWESRSALADKPVGLICRNVPRLAQQLKRAGIHTGEQFTAVPERLVHRFFGKEGIYLWRACRGIGGVAEPEVRCRHDTLLCRAVLPPRTLSQRAVHSHVRRIAAVFLKALHQSRRQANRVRFVFGDEALPETITEQVVLTQDETPLPVLVRLLQTVLEHRRSGAAVTSLELDAHGLVALHGQLELFSGFEDSDFIVHPAPTGLFQKPLMN